MENLARANSVSSSFSFRRWCPANVIILCSAFFPFVHHTNAISPDVGADEQIKKNHWNDLCGKIEMYAFNCMANWIELFIIIGGIFYVRHCEADNHNVMTTEHSFWFFVFSLICEHRNLRPLYNFANGDYLSRLSICERKKLIQLHPNDKRCYPVDSAFNWHLNCFNLCLSLRRVIAHSS